MRSEINKMNAKARQHAQNYEMNMSEKKCKHVLVTGKVGVILGLLSRLHIESQAWEGPEAPAMADEIEAVSAALWALDAKEPMVYWGFELPLPCHCEVCYRVFTDSVALGRANRIRTEDFCRYKDTLRTEAVTRAATISKINQAIVTLLPTIYPRLLT